MEIEKSGPSIRYLKFWGKSAAQRKQKMDVGVAFIWLAQK
jgi:hypothetical protein